MCEKKKLYYKHYDFNCSKLTSLTYMYVAIYHYHLVMVFKSFSLILMQEHALHTNFFFLFIKQGMLITNKLIHFFGQWWNIMVWIRCICYNGCNEWITNAKNKQNIRESIDSVVQVNLASIIRGSVNDYSIDPILRKHGSDSPLTGL